MSPLESWANPSWDRCGALPELRPKSAEVPQSYFLIGTSPFSGSSLAYSVGLRHPGKVGCSGTTGFAYLTNQCFDLFYVRLCDLLYYFPLPVTRACWQSDWTNYLMQIIQPYHAEFSMHSFLMEKLLI